MFAVPTRSSNMEHEKTVSIIIPAYNMEAYIAKCLNSLYNQDIPESDYEIIVVDDGSSDATAAKAKECGHENLKVITQPNSRQGGARNTGLREAKGRYVVYVDADDRLAPNMLGKILRRFDESGADIVLYNIVDSELGDSVSPRPVKEEGKVYTGREFLSMRKFTTSPVYAFSRKFLLENELFFEPGVFFEDARLAPKMYFCASKIAYLNENVYVRYIRPNSSFYTFTSDRTSEVLEAVYSMVEFAKQKTGDSAYPDLMFAAAGAFNCFLSRALSLSRRERKKIRLRKGTLKLAVDCLLSSRKIKYMFEAPVLAAVWPFLFGVGAKS